LPKLLLKGQAPPKPCQLRKQVEVFSQPLDKAVAMVEQQLPKEFNWRDSQFGGKNFLEPVMDQGECGSCYMVSTVRMLTARHKIKTNNSAAEPF